jgi:hypothetical protein
MADLTCRTCNNRVPDQNATQCDFCGENPHQEPGGFPPVPRPGVTVLVATARVALEQGEKILLGREGDPRFITALEKFDNVGREHVEVTVGEDRIVALPRKTKNGTFIGDCVLQPGEKRNIELPVTIRLAGNCYVHFEVARADFEVIDE